jgi:hypothetical protein
MPGAGFIDRAALWGRLTADLQARDARECHLHRPDRPILTRWAGATTR